MLELVSSSFACRLLNILHAKWDYLNLSWQNLICLILNVFECRFFSEEFKLNSVFAFSLEKGIQRRASKEKSKILMNKLMKEHDTELSGHQAHVWSPDALHRISYSWRGFLTLHTSSEAAHLVCMHTLSQIHLAHVRFLESSNGDTGDLPNISEASSPC